MTVLIAGVGMIPFAKPGASAPYDEMGEAAIRLALKDLKRRFRRGGTGLCRLCLRRQYQRPAGDLSSGDDRHSHRQR